MFQGEIALVFSGYMIRQGAFEPENVLLLAISGAVLGDIGFFLTGRFFKSRAEELLHRHRKKFSRVQAWFRRYGGWIIVFERFVYGAHIPSLLMVGMSGFGWVKFLMLEIIGVLMWAITFTTIGYYFGDTVVQVLSMIHHHIAIVVLAALFFYVVYLLYLPDEDEDEEKEPK